MTASIQFIIIPFSFTEPCCDGALNCNIELAIIILECSLWGHQLWDINCRMCVCVCVCPPTYRYIAPRMIQRIILKFCGYAGCDDATNVSNFGYEPIKFNQLNQ